MVVATGTGALAGIGIGSLIPGGKVPFALQAGAVITAVVILAVAGMAGSIVAVRRITAIDPIIALGAAA
jgi:putative ABC transport system permease protein